MVNPTKRPESVLVLVHLGSKVLCLRRLDDPTFWQSVTGSLLEGESPLQAAMRELHEETGLTPQHGVLKDTQTKWWFTIYPHWRYRYPPDITQNLEHVFVFTLQQAQDISLSNEHTEFCWLGKEKALKKMRSKTNQKAIELFIEED